MTIMDANTQFRIGVGSTNPVKVQAVREAVEFVHSSRVANGRSIRAQTVAVVSVNAASGVSAQPLSDQETRTGAQNRAAAVLAGDASLQLAFGLEGGVHTDVDDGLVYTTVWVCVRDRAGKELCVNGAKFQLPDDVSQPILGGKEMGDVMNEAYGRSDIKQSEGMIGILTGGVVNRTSEYMQLAALAYARFCEM